jgi:transposase
VVDAIPQVQSSRGRPRHRPKELYADRGYDSDSYRDQLKRRGIEPRVARRRTAHGSGWGRFRWVVERTFSWLHGFGRLRRRWDRHLSIHQAWLLLAMCLICSRFL